MPKVSKQQPVKARNTPRSRGIASVNAPASFGVRQGPRTPRTRAVAGGTMVHHTEFLTDLVTTTSDWALHGTYAIQPAITQNSRGAPLFTWLPKIAAQFDYYEFSMLKIHYMNACSTQQAGTIYMSADPNPDGLPPEGLAEMRASQFVVDGSPWLRHTLDLSKMVSGKKLRTRDSGVTSYPLYDAGRVFVASVGASPLGRLGYIEVEYTISLTVPQYGPRVSDTGAGLVPGFTKARWTSTQALPVTYPIGKTIAGARPCITTHVITGLLEGQDSLVTREFWTYSPDYQLAWDGCVFSFKDDSASGWRFTQPGFYRVLFVGNYDVLDYATVALNLAKASSTTSPFTRAYDASVYNGTVKPFTTAPRYLRGFKGTSTPLIENDDPGFQVEWRVYVDKVTDIYTILGGVRDISLIGENDTANMILLAASTGASFLEITYLGQGDSANV